MAYISFKPSAFFNNVLYTGNAGTNAITGVGFQPDMIWNKIEEKQEIIILLILSEELRRTST